MKKLIFGLVATVMFGFIGNAKIATNNPSGSNTKDISINDSSRTYCFDVGVSIGIVSVSTTVCCAPRTNGHSNWVDCWLPENRSAISGQIFLENFQPSILEMVKKGNLKDITIEKSSICEIDGVNYIIHKGLYTIERSEDGALFISVYIEKIK